MSGSLYLLLLLPAMPLVYDDFRTRRVDVVWLAGLGLVSFTLGYVERGWTPLLLYTAVNICVLLLLVAAVALYLLLRGRGVRALFNQYFGAGDAVFMLAVTPLFSSAAYVRFLLVSCLAALVCRAISRRKTIPLAGVMGLTLVVYALCKTTGLWS